MLETTTNSETADRRTKTKKVKLTNITNKETDRQIEKQTDKDENIAALLATRAVINDR